MMRFRWPRGRYNGQRIVGFELTIKLDVTYWRLLWRWQYGNPVLIVGPLRFYGQLNYALRERESK